MPRKAAAPNAVNSLLKLEIKERRTLGGAIRMFEPYSTARGERIEGVVQRMHRAVDHATEGVVRRNHPQGGQTVQAVQRFDRCFREYASDCVGWRQGNTVPDSHSDVIDAFHELEQEKVSGKAPG